MFVEDDVIARDDLDKKLKFKQKFYYYWKITLLIILVISIVYMFYEWRSIDREGLACKNAPFVWGKLKAEEKGIHCSYECVSDSLNRINGIWVNDS